MRVEIASTLADGGGYWQGVFHLSQLDVTGEDGDMIKSEITLVSDGDWAWTDAAA